jgi:lipoprotein-anchoring transpeptidase ErfK/SrfK
MFLRHAFAAAVTVLVGFGLAGGPASATQTRQECVTSALKWKAKPTAEDRKTARTKCSEKIAKANAAEKAKQQREAERLKLRKEREAKRLALRQTQAKKQQVALNDRVVSGQKCKGFMGCVFGTKRGVRVKRDPRIQTAAFGATRSVFSRNTRQTVAWTEAKYPVGSIVVKTPERALYFVQPGGKALRYSVGVGREGFQWSGTNRISRKAEWPSWTPPKEMIAREAAKGITIPEFMEGGPGNPLGARALYIGGSIYRIHGTNNEKSIGGAVSSGCIRMMNADVIDLYGRVKTGARIFVYQ